MKQTLHLYNHWHYGDIFLSRCIIKPLLEKFDIKFYHNLKTPLLNDIDGLEEIVGIPHEFDKQFCNFEKNLINTWMGQENGRYIKSEEYGISFEKYLPIINNILNFYGIENKDLTYFLPQVNYLKIKNYENLTFEIKKLKTKFDKIILINSGEVHSGQSGNFSFNQVIQQLSSEFSNYIFLVTSDDIILKNNIINTYHMTNCNPDLLQISYISTFCDLIVGRSSGPYTFSLVKENLMNKNKIFISFNRTYSECNFFGKVDCKFVCSNDYSYKNILETIKNNII